MCFGIRILIPFHLNILNIPIQNINCPKNTGAEQSVMSSELIWVKHMEAHFMFEENNTILCSLSALITYHKAWNETM